MAKRSIRKVRHLVTAPMMRELLQEWKGYDRPERVRLGGFPRHVRMNQDKFPLSSEAARALDEGLRDKRDPVYLGSFDRPEDPCALGYE